MMAYNLTASNVRRALARYGETVLDRVEDVCDLVDRTVVFPMDDVRAGWNLWRVHRARRSVRRQLLTLDTGAHAERVRLISVWAALEDALAAQVELPDSNPPASPVGDVLRALRTVETAHARTLPHHQATAPRDPAPAEIEHVGRARLDELATYWSLRDRQATARAFREAVRAECGEQEADTVTALYQLA